MKSTFAVRFVLALLGFIVSQQAFAAGYEKSIMWGGRSSGFAGIATPYTTGADALYFNPAGIVADKTGQEMTFNVSPVWSQFKGPINNTNDEATSSTNMSTPFGLIYGNTVNETWGFAVGGYVSGGSVANFEDFSYTAPTSQGADVKTDLKLVELAAGVGYKATENLKLGASFRQVYASGEFAFVQRASIPVAGYSFVNPKFTDIKDTKPGFALGAQYKVDENTQIGFRYRSEVKIEASGTLGGNVHTTNAGAVTLQDNPGTAKTTFPQAATLGVLHNLNDMWTILGEAAWTNYSKVDNIVLEGTVRTSTGTTLAVNPAVQQYWHDQYNYRLAAEYKGMAWPLRFGYGYTSKVTNEDYARASFTPPAVAHTLTLGTGTDFNVGEKPLRFDTGLEYTAASGSGNPNGAAAGSAAGDLRQGTFSTSSYALHLGVGYMF
jgi:long-chain fatty acid transport protein